MNTYEIEWDFPERCQCRRSYPNHAEMRTALQNALSEYCQQTGTLRALVNGKEWYTATFETH